MRWDIFCRVIDNHGDLGVCWRLSRALAAAGDPVRLWVDDASALAWMAPAGARGVRVVPWGDPVPPRLGDVVVEAFGCELPVAVVAAMAARPRPPVWINVEYLSAEKWVERSHGLPSPVHRTLAKWFFFPGFTPATGGLLRAKSSPPAQARAWLAGLGLAPRDGERVASVFGYDTMALADWLPALAATPTLLLTTPGAATAQIQAATRPPGLRAIALPWLDQVSYDRLLQACDLNMVRGEDSFVQAHWADAPLLWHVYPQHDGAHAAKLDAWLDLLLDGAAPALAQAVRQAQRRWNRLDGGAVALPDFAAWRDAHRALRARLLDQDDLATRLRRFAAEKGALPC